MIIQPGNTFSAKEAWHAIHTYWNPLATRKMYVKQEFVSLQKQPIQSMLQYLQSVKKVVDNMYGMGEYLTDKDIVFQTLQVLMLNIVLLRELLCKDLIFFIYGASILAAH